MPESDESFTFPSEKEEESRVEAKPASKPSSAPSIDSLSSLWEKGILSTMTQKLEEMKKLRDEVDKIIEDKANEAFDNEQKKVRILLDSQRTLLLEKINSFIEQKGQEIDSMFTSRMEELKELNVKTQQSLDEMNSLEERSKLLSEEIKQKLSEMPRLKDEASREFRQELANFNRQSEEFLQKSSQHLKEMDDRVNKTLSLNSAVAEGLKLEAKQLSDKLLKDASKKIDNLTLQKNKELEKDLTDLKNSLQLVKDQFIKVVDKKISEFNKGIKRFNDEITALSGQTESRIKLVDRKIEELTAFEENFANELGIILDELIKRKKGQQ